jgi:hypothetical protein
MNYVQQSKATANYGDEVEKSSNLCAVVEQNAALQRQ